MSAASEAWRAGSLRTGAPPLLLYLELTARCNSRCIMCYQASDPIRNSPDMTLPLARATADRLFPTAAVVDLRGFGETLIWPPLAEFLAHVAKSSQRPAFKLVSNAQPAGPWEALDEVGTHLRVSFDGPDRETYEHIRAHSSFDRAIARLRWWNRRASADRRAWLLVTVQSGNVGRLQELVSLAVEEGCRGIFLVPVVAGPDAPWAVTAASADASIAPAAQAALEQGLEVVFPHRLLPNVRRQHRARTLHASSCSAPWTSLLIRHDGRFSPCSHFGMGLGTWPEEDPVDHPGVLEVRRGLLGGTPVARCVGCDRNALAYVSPDGTVHDPTWKVLERVHA